MRTKAAACAASLFIALGTLFAIVLPGSSTAGAGISTHEITTWGYFGTDVEGAVQGTFRCNSTTGVWKLSLNGIQVIESDGATEWPSLSVSALIGPFDENSGSLPIDQDSTDGLFEISFRSISGSSTGGNLTNPGVDCATADQVAILGGDGIDFLVGTMS